MIVELGEARIGKRYKHKGITVEVTHLDVDPFVVIVTPNHTTFYAVNINELEVIGRWMKRYPK